MPVSIKFGTKEINDPEHEPKTTKDKDGKETTEPHKQITVDNVILTIQIRLGQNNQQI